MYQYRTIRYRMYCTIRYHMYSTILNEYHSTIPVQPVHGMVQYSNIIFHCSAHLVKLLVKIPAQMAEPDSVTGMSPVLRENGELCFENSLLFVNDLKEQ